MLIDAAQDRRAALVIERRWFPQPLARQSRSASSLSRRDDFVGSAFQAQRAMEVKAAIRCVYPPGDAVAPSWLRIRHPLLPASQSPQIHGA
jgi:hypothetical protein